MSVNLPTQSVRSELLYVAPLCPVGHLPHKGGDHARHLRLFSCTIGDWRLAKATRPADLPPLWGEMSDRTEGGAVPPRLHASGAA